MEEVWRKIEHSNYEVSNLGNVRNSETLYALKPKKNNRGYARVKIRIDGKEKTRFIHRLVAIAFIPNPHNYSSVNHIDECKVNNHVDNLEWCTIEYNNLYGTGQKRGIEQSKLVHNKATIQYDKQGNTIAKYPSTVEAAKATGVPKYSIQHCARGDSRTAYGFVFAYAQ